MVDREWPGRWWIPGQQAHATVGDLRLSDDSFVLALQGSLGPKAASQVRDLMTHPTLDVSEPVALGLSQANEKITLLDCDCVGWEMTGFRDVRSSSWMPHAALLGVHLESPSPAFSEAHLELDHLMDWCRGVGLHHEFKQDLGGVQRITVNAERKLLGEAEVSGAHVELSARPLGTVGVEQAKLSIHPVFHFVFEFTQSWREVLQAWVRPIRDLVSFATLRPNRITYVGVKTGESIQGELLVRFLEPSAASDGKKTLGPSDMLFTVAGLPSGFETGLEKWFALHRHYESVFNLLLGIEYAPFIYDETRFLAMAQAAEVFHRIAVPKNPLSKAEHKRRVEAVACAIEDDEVLSAWAKPILTSANQRTLRERLSWLVDRAGELRQPVTGGEPDQFVARVADTRNYLTHLGKMKRTVLGDEARYWHGQALGWLLRFFLMAKLGFTDEESIQAIKRNQRFIGFSRNLAESVADL
jgi:hypothetical protein